MHSSIVIGHMVMNLTERNIVTNQLNLFISGYKMSDKRLKTTQTRGVSE